MGCAFVAALGTVAALLVPAAAPAAARVETYRYEAGIGDVIVLCDSDRGGVCLFPEAGDGTVAFEVDDDLADRVGIEVGFYDVYGDRIGDYITGCNSTGTLTIPPETLEVDIYIDGPILGPMDCLGQGIGVGTTGTITVSWT